MRSVLSLAAAAIVALLPVLRAEAAEPKPISIREAVDAAMQNNPMLAVATAGRSAARAKVWEARSTWLPQIEVTGTYMHGDNPVFVFGSLLEQGRFGPEHFDPNFLNNPPSLTNYRTALNVRYAFFDQLRRLAMTQQASIGAAAADDQLEQARQQLRFETLRAYYGLVLAQAGKEVADKAVASAESQVAKIRASYESGMIVQSDLLAGEVQLADFRQQQIDAAGNVEIAQAALQTAMGSRELEPIVATSALDLKTADVADDYALVARAMANRTETKKARLDARASDLQTRIAGGQFLPRVDGFASVGASGTEWTTSGRDKTIGIVGTWRVLDPGRAARYAQSRSGQIMANQEVRRVDDQIRFETIEASRKFLAAQQRVTVAQHASEQAAEATRIVRERYGAGLTTITEVLRADTAELHANMNLLGARADYATGYARLLLATGDLTGTGAFE